MTDPQTALTRRFAKAAEPLHSCAYYAEEINRFTEMGYSGWWHAYFAYRSAPMGKATAQQVMDAFYNFAPRMVDKAVPNCWEVMSPSQVRQTQLLLVDRALHRIFGDYKAQRELAYVSEVLKTSIPELDTKERPLFAAWAGEPWPDSPLLDLWHATTLLREYRFDGHNSALRQAGLSGLGCHLMMAADGRGTPEIIQKIRGWSHEEWKQEAAELRSRGWITSDGQHTPLGRSVRRGVELATDQNAQAIVVNLGDERSGKVLEVLEQVAAFLIETGVVPGTWPPKHLGQMGSA
ncbi:MAG TPA: hypothetical protein EYQ34_06275 [Acidimicrobiia bacterium]|nr:hypothetical protein [Acidimicrobiia bacterium]